MVEPKIRLDDAVQLMSSTLSHHAETIRNLQQTLDSLQPQLNNQFITFREETQQELQTIESNLKGAIDAKEAVWSEVTSNMQSLQRGLVEPTQLVQNRSTNRPSAPPPPPLNQPVNATSFSGDTTSPPPRQMNSTVMSENNRIQPSYLTSNTVIVPPISSFPTFSGKTSDRPRQFLLRVVEYTRTVNKWSSDTLLKGISQFLKDSALEWYCQLYITNNLPAGWNQSVNRFLAQFHSPLRMAQQEQEWSKCKQQENEAINEFVVHQCSLWLEQKPDEGETEFIKHLFRKMRPDMLTFMIATRSASLEEIILEAQQVEEILYLRNKEARSRINQRLKPANTTPLLSLNTRNSNPPRNSQQPPTTQFNPTCWRCYETGHYSTNCPLNDSRRTFDPIDNNQQPLPSRSKNT